MVSIETSERQNEVLRGAFCFVTEVDLEVMGDGATTTDQETLRCLRKLGNVDVIFLNQTRYKPIPLALVVFFFQILKSFSKPYNAYFSRGSTTSAILIFLRILTLKETKIVQRSLSVPFGSREVKFLKFGKVESFLRYVLFLALERLVYSQVDSVTVAAETYKEELIQSGVKRDNIYVVNFVASEEFFTQPLKSKIDGTFKFCYVGGFHLYQDLLPMLEAFEIVIRTKLDVELFLVGDGPQRPKLEERATKKELKHSVKFVGKVPRSSLPAILSKIDCFISLRRAPGLSISVVEAAAAGKPIIAFAPENNTTYNNYFAHRKDIYLVHSVSSDEIAKAMALLSKDHHLRNTIAHGARLVALKHFNEKSALEQLEKLLRKI